MYILFEVHYPDRPIARSAVAAAWKEAGLTGAPAVAGPEATPLEVQAAVRGVLTGAGANISRRNGDVEVPEAALALLEKLESFHHTLYPEMKTDRSRHGFQYESLEWLGEF